jgi:hypothetical protein
MALFRPKGDAMTEQEWLTCTDPQPMFLFLQNRTSYRKFRLFAVACCRRIWPLVTQERSRLAVDVAERYADDLAHPDELEDVFQDASEETEGLDNATEAAAYAATWDDVQAAEQAAVYAAYAADEASPDPTPPQARWGTAGTAERAAQAELLRCVFGNPFHPPAWNPSLVTPAVTGLAETVYRERTLDLLPVLADALEEAGCDNAEILRHCRGKTCHARGCWVVDLLLAKN